MESKTYTQAAEVENKHWWFQARRIIFQSLLNKHVKLREGVRVLEVGCGNGGNFSMLSEYGELFGVELDDGARAVAIARGVATVEKGWLPDAVPYAGEIFDLVAVLDVIEHVDDDAAAISALKGKLNADGLLMISVPAYNWLWSSHDELSHHKRRYTLPQIRKLLDKCGFDVVYASYFNTFLFPISVLYIILTKIFNVGSSVAMGLPAPFINSSLRYIFALERYILSKSALPFGISIVVFARASKVRCSG
ncbi:class I SAM-dependent methyltransferase [Polaromonas sp. YR568]|uniref:class I SAM-dependent methyltransferase n=1 Tax=Polaromonas sp. YR568 TaxID=1855301 RepID=UPI003137E31E